MEAPWDLAGQATYRDGGVGEDECAPAFYPPANPSIADPTKPTYITQQIPCDIKPRLTKEQHDILEGEFQKQHKPNTITKKRFAESLGVSLDKVNVSVIPSGAAAAAWQRG